MGHVLQRANAGAGPANVRTAVAALAALILAQGIAAQDVSARLARADLPGTTLRRAG